MRRQCRIDFVIRIVIVKPLFISSDETHQQISILVQFEQFSSFAHTNVLVSLVDSIWTPSIHLECVTNLAHACIDGLRAHVEHLGYIYR